MYDDTLNNAAIWLADTVFLVGSGIRRSSTKDTGKFIGNAYHAELAS
jgi:hypothetical protein